MSVYVDEMNAAYGRMRMSHMLADSTEELLAMADAIGLDRRWLQKRGTVHEHFDLSKTKKAEAIRRGAIVVSIRELGQFLRSRRAALQPPADTEKERK